MQSLILVKHSLPEVLENIPAREWRLSAEGRARCGRLAGRLAKYQPGRIISSLEPKARETADLIASELGMSPILIDGLHEHDRTNVGFLSRDEFQEAVREFFDNPDELVFGRETADQAALRFHSAIDTVSRRFPNERLVVVSHGTVISLFVSKLTGIPGYSLWKELGLPSFVILDMQSKTLIARENIQ